jgi:hypothetical protein
MLRSIGAVVGGFATMALLVMIGSLALIAAFVPGGLAAMRTSGTGAMPTPTPRYYVMTIALSLLAAVAGGWVTAHVASRAISGHLIALGAVVLVFGIVSAFMSSQTPQPGWYKMLIPVIGVAGIALSAALFPRVN